MCSPIIISNDSKNSQFQASQESANKYMAADALIDLVTGLSTPEIRTISANVILRIRPVVTTGNSETQVNKTQYLWLDSHSIQKVFCKKN